MCFTVLRQNEITLLPEKWEKFKKVLKFRNFFEKTIDFFVNNVIILMIAFGRASAFDAMKGRGEQGDG